MNTQPRQVQQPGRMSADEYLAWALDQPSGRFELVDGEVVAMASEQMGHAITKGEAFVALRSAVRAHGLNCQVITDGMAIRIDDATVYEPDAQVRYGPPLPTDVLLVPDPLIVVEVLSPSTRAVDTGKKLTGYFALPSLHHYLVLDPDDRTVVHYRREEGGDGVAVRILGPRQEGKEPELVLDPPGLTLRREHLFEAS